ncbi:YqjF family protein [Pedobacter sp. JCM 36344]|uniref:YqjF family protein n=1 Tax=Pedobacter sp. JCM 36344 TaxID=3374280 RepID=UPI00397A4EA9
MSFLKAEWRKLIMANYRVDRDLLLPYLPVGTELDFWNNTCYVSLIGFLFKNVRLLGIAVPFHTNFEEVNLRFYVRYKDAGVWKRGAVFVKEIVPKYALSFVANTIYNEKYQTLPMKHSWEIKNDDLLVEYNWKTKGKWQGISVCANANLSEIPVASETEFITEHYWGYSRYNKSVTNEYEVRHPKWKQYAIKSYQIDADFCLTYGDHFKVLDNTEPVSVFLAEGSEISIERKKAIRAML